MPCSPSVPGTCSGTTPGKPIPARICLDDYYSQPLVRTSHTFFFPVIVAFESIPTGIHHAGDTSVVDSADIAPVTSATFAEVLLEILAGEVLLEVKRARNS